MIQNPPESMDGVSGDDGAAFDAAAGVVPHEPRPEGERPAPAAPKAEAAEVVSFEEWYSFLAAIMAVGAYKLKLRSLAFDKNDPAAVKAFRALYDTLGEIPWLRWMLIPGGKWAERLLAIGAFFGPMLLGVLAELQARRSGRSVAPGAAPAAPVADPMAAFKAEAARIDAELKPA
jgi:hypothetical protein